MKRGYFLVLVLGLVVLGFAIGYFSLNAELSPAPFQDEGEVYPFPVDKIVLKCGESTEEVLVGSATEVRTLKRYDARYWTRAGALADCNSFPEHYPGLWENAVSSVKGYVEGLAKAYCEGQGSAYLENMECRVPSECDPGLECGSYVNPNPVECPLPEGSVRGPEFVNLDVWGKKGWKCYIEGTASTSARVVLGCDSIACS